MITITQATDNDLKIIQDIAYKTWPISYGEILSKAQLDYMLENFYSAATLYDNLTNKNHHFLLAYEDLACLGFASYEHHYLNKNVTRLHKLYMVPESQGKGIGKLVLDRIEDLANENRSETISLNVNKLNKALSFYKKMGFRVVAEEELAIGNGYIMDDYKMEKKL